MIRAGRDVVDTYGIAALRGQPYDTAARRKPWDQRGHPAPVNEAAARPGPGGRKRLWDREQAAAYIIGEPIPAITATDDEHDLLDATDVAAARSMTVPAFHALVREGKLAGPDASPCGVPHWYRVTVDAMRPDHGGSHRRRAEQGRPTGEDTERIRQRLLAALDRVPRRAGGRVNVAALAREARVSRLTADRLVRRLELNTPAEPARVNRRSG